MPSKFATWHLRACLGAVALMLVLPFVMAHHFNPITAFFEEWTAAALGLAALTWLLRRNDGKPLELPEIALLPLGLMLIAVLQPILLPEAVSERVQLFCLYMIWAALLVVLGRRLAEEVGTEALADLMAAAILAGALLAAASGAAQLAGVGRLPWIFPHLGGGLRGNLAQPNNFADYLWLGVASALYLRSRAKLGASATALALGLLLPIAVLSGSRTIWFYAIGVVLLTLAWTWRQRDAAARGLRLWGLGALAAMVTLQAAFSLELIPLPQVFTTAGGRLAEAGYDPVRLALWRVALDTFGEHPWLGAGFGQYTQQFHLHVLDLMPRRLPGLPEHSHNILLNLLAELGVAAGLLFVALAARWALAFARGPRTPTGWWMAACLTVLAIHSNLEYPLWYAFFLGIAALLAGAGSRTNRKLDLSARAPYAVAAILALGVLCLYNLHHDYSLLEDTLNHRLDARSPDELNRRVEENMTSLAKGSMLLPYVDLASAYLMVDDGEALPIKLATCERAQRFSASRDVVFKCAHLLALAGRDDEARLALRRAVAAYPDRAELVQQQWQQRKSDDPAIARLLADFPPIAQAAR